MAAASGSRSRGAVSSDAGRRGSAAGAYDPSRYTPFAVTVDLVVLTVRAERLVVLLVARGVEPVLGRLALPGGFVQPEEGLLDPAHREVREEPGLAGVWHPEQLVT